MELATTLKRLTAALALALVVAAIASGAHADTTPTVSPTHRWTADGTAADSVGTDDGVALNGADYVPGVRGQAFHLNGPAAEFRFDTSGGQLRGSGLHARVLHADDVTGAAGDRREAADLLTPEASGASA